MPKIIAYSEVLERMTALGMRCVYYNAGAFAPAGDEPVSIVGWIGPDDPTIRPDLPAKLVRVLPPYSENLAARLAETWQRDLPGPAWVLPKSHWSFELAHGNGGWLAPALAEAGLTADQIASLAPLTNAAAIAFEVVEAAQFTALTRTLLDHLRTSDFAVLFPDHPHLVTVHHHKQLWWQTRDNRLVERLSDASSPR